MQPNLADIQKLLTEWYQQTIDNPSYAAAIAISVWLFSMFFYNIRMYLINKEKRKIQNKLNKTHKKLEERVFQLSEIEETIAASSTQLTEQKQLIEEIKSKHKNRNKQIILNTKALATKFNLSAPKLGEPDILKKDEDIWQQQDNIINQLSDRVTKEQREKSALEINHQEKIKTLDEKEALVNDLQTKMDRQTQKFSKILNEQNNKQTQQVKETLKPLSPSPTNKNESNIKSTKASFELEDELIPDLIGPITFAEEQSALANNTFGSKKTVRINKRSSNSSSSPIDAANLSKDSLSDPVSIQISDTSNQQFSTSKAIPTEEQEAEKERNLRELKKLLDETKKKRKENTNSSGKKKADVVLVPQKQKIVRVKTKSHSNNGLTQKMKGFFKK